MLFRTMLLLLSLTGSKKRGIVRMAPATVAASSDFAADSAELTIFQVTM